MWWKKDIEDRSALKIIRVAVALMYMYIAVSLMSSHSDTNISSEPVKIISNFCLMLAFIVLSPAVESFFSKCNLKFMNDISVALSFFVIVILHVYMISSLGIPNNIGYIVISFYCNIASQLPIVFLAKKVFKNEMQ